ncbi:hypothetical protein B9Z51_04115 [Limnohabitans sp. T6-5]|uniref:DUF3306 domain-containing protein n=1 Tax=Limnohabitans sp. T6-5 TaxID=1100724 RepID=UPI000D3A510A|nr:DUF3306 domain-containing protein [Limnohabitans sp. T6-5]PUE11483.1 hypothetical protein B9Z51_04115 [Limnohabitans sp. T6-5]
MSDHFFSRWSRRKQAAAQGLPADEPDQPLAQPGAGEGREGLPAEGDVPQDPHASGVNAPPEATAAEALPTLQDAQALTPSSDFQSFMRQGVPAEVRNAAVKKLFTDPHFNVMDGLDIYIGDYSTPDPLPAGMLEKMVGAQFLNLVPPEREQGDPVSTEMPPHENPAVDSVATAQTALVAQSPHSQVREPDTQRSPSEHDNPDLQLQPNHAPASPDAGQSTG